LRLKLSMKDSNVGKFVSDVEGLLWIIAEMVHGRAAAKLNAVLSAAGMVTWDWSMRVHTEWQP